MGGGGGKEGDGMALKFFKYLRGGSWILYFLKITLLVTYGSQHYNNTNPLNSSWNTLNHNYQGFTSVRRRLIKYRRFIKKFSLFLGRSEAQNTPQKTTLILHSPSAPFGWRWPACQTQWGTQQARFWTSLCLHRLSRFESPGWRRNRRGSRKRQPWRVPIIWSGGGGGGENWKIYETKKIPKSTLLADTTRGLIITKTNKAQVSRF